MGVKVLSYNIHKGFTFGNRRYIFEEIKKAIRVLHPDIVFLQELHSSHPEFHETTNDVESHSPLEHLADTIWPHHAYGKNAIYTGGHHGNGIMSKFPFRFYENIDISTNRFERRGLLHGVVHVPRQKQDLHLICLHLNLLDSGRRQQITALVDRINSKVDPGIPMIIAGDFNDWTLSTSRQIRECLHLNEAFLTCNQKHARTFPSWFPFLTLDRIYFRGLTSMEATTLNYEPWSSLSDHLPVFAEFTFG